MKALLYLLIGTLVLASAGPDTWAQSYDVSWFTIDGGGGQTSGGGYSLNGTLGQPDAGAMSGGPFTIHGGFWGGAISSPPGPPPILSIRLGVPSNGTNTVILSWLNPSTGYVLQQTADMNAGGGGWNDVTQMPVVNGSNKEVTLAATGRFCMFRLRRP